MARGIHDDRYRRLIGALITARKDANALKRGHPCRDTLPHRFSPRWLWLRMSFYRCWRRIASRGLFGPWVDHPAEACTRWLMTLLDSAGCCSAVIAPTQTLETLGNGMVFLGRRPPTQGLSVAIRMQWLMTACAALPANPRCALRPCDGPPR